MEFVKQCVLKNGNLTTTAWIVEESAVVGQWVELKEDKTQWEVKEVGHSRIERSEALARSHENKTIFKSISQDQGG
jgi:histone acetyltransferase (RNA polymerase elongator complex component)